MKLPLLYAATRIIYVEGREKRDMEMEEMLEKMFNMAEGKEAILVT